MSEPPVPAAVLEAERQRKKFLNFYVMPYVLWIIVSTFVGIPVAVNLLSDHQMLVAMVFWFAGLFLGLVGLAWGGRKLRGSEEILVAWHNRQLARNLADAETVFLPPSGETDGMVEGIVSLLGPESRGVVVACRERSRGLRAEAARARAALEGLPAEGQGAKALREAAEHTAARASELDDQLASLYAQAMASSVDSPADTVDALQRLRALAEVDGKTKGAGARQARRARELG